MAASEQAKFHGLRSAKVIVTGAAGFIGSHLVESLAEVGADVVAVARNSSKNFPGVELVTADMTDPVKLRETVADHKPEVIFHLASQLLPSAHKDPLKDAQTTIGGMLNLLQAANCCPVVPGIVFSSTWAVYGINNGVPQTENHPLQPTTAYGLSKSTAEHYLRMLHKGPWSILRYCNIYGPRGEANVTNIFIRKVLAGEPIPLMGTGEQTRSLTYVDDTVEATMLAGLKPEAQGQAINITATDTISVKKLAETIMQLVGVDVDFNYLPKREGEADNFYPSASLAKKLLGFETTTPLEVGLQKTIAWARKES